MANYAREGKIKDRLADEGVREVDLELFMPDHRSGGFDLADMTPEWFAAQKAQYPHRFIGARSEDDELYLRAFGPSPNVTAQGEVVKRCNGDLAKANEIAARYGSVVGSTKPGTDPNGTGDDKSATTTNPWAPNYRGTVDQAMAERARLIKIWGTVRCASMAKSHGVDLAGRPLRSKVA